VLFIPSCLGVTGLTGASDRSDRCVPSVGFASGELLVPCVFGSCCCWLVLSCLEGVLLGFVKGSSSLQVLFFGGVLVPGPKEVTEALWNICCAAAAATGLTGSVHWSDRCHWSDRRKPLV
jgi:hypothetical protein